MGEYPIESYLTRSEKKRFFLGGGGGGGGRKGGVCVISVSVN